MEKVKFGVVGGRCIFLSFQRCEKESEIIEYTAIYDVDYKMHKKWPRDMSITK